MDKLTKKILNVKKVVIEGISFELKKVSPEDYLDKEGIPISKWQSEAEFMLSKQREGSVTLAEVKKSWVRVFKKAIISVDGKEDIAKLIEKIPENYTLASQLYNAIGEHCFGVKKNKKSFLKLR